MVTKHPRFLLILALVGILFVDGFSRAQTPSASQRKNEAKAGQSGTKAHDEESWPREIKNGDTTFVVHQPQLESWDGRDVSVLAAIEAKVAGRDKPLYGAVRAAAKVNIDKTTRMAEFTNLNFVKAIFPSSPENEASYLRILQNGVMQKVRQISLDRFETALTVMEAEQKFNAYPLKNDPPAIIHSTVPAILVYVDGTPSYRQMKSGDFSRIINTRPLILKDEKKFYLHLFDG